MRHEGLVDTVVHRIADALHPKHVIVFGSQATGQAGAESGLDLVLVYEGSKSKREVRREVHELFEHPQFSLDVFVLTPEELETGRKIANTLAREISERGIVWYG